MNLYVVPMYHLPRTCWKGVGVATASEAYASPAALSSKLIPLAQRSVVVPFGETFAVVISPMENKVAPSPPISVAEQ